MVEAQIIKWIFLKESMMKENKLDQTVGLHHVYETEKKAEPSEIITYFHLCACHCASYTGEGSKMNSPRAYPRSTHILHTHKRLMLLSTPTTGKY